MLVVAHFGVEVKLPYAQPFRAAVYGLNAVDGFDGSGIVAGFFLNAHERVEFAARVGVGGQLGVQFYGFGIAIAAGQIVGQEFFVVWPFGHRLDGFSDLRLAFGPHHGVGRAAHYQFHTTQFVERLGRLRLFGQRRLQQFVLGIVVGQGTPAGSFQEERVKSLVALFGLHRGRGGLRGMAFQGGRLFSATCRQAYGHDQKPQSADRVPDTQPSRRGFIRAKACQQRHCP